MDVAIFIFLLVAVICLLAFIVCKFIKFCKSMQSQNRKFENDYNESEYFKNTGNTIYDIYSDKGKMGEYLCYRYLREYEEEGAKFLFNVYLPRQNGKYVEVDLIMLSYAGIFVIESKNRGGEIIGNEYDHDWIQILPARGGGIQQHTFYNPIKQNDFHIDVLEELIGDYFDCYSVIVFSESSRLNISYEEDNSLYIIRRDELKRTIYRIHETAKRYEYISLDKFRIDSIYEMLYSFSHPGEDVKEKHSRQFS